MNDFIKNDALLYYKSRLSTSYILEDKTTGEVIGYFSLAHDRISLTDFPSNSIASYQQDNKAGCRFVTVDAYASALPFYYNQGFVPLSKENEGADTRQLYFDLKQL